LALYTSVPIVAGWTDSKAEALYTLVAVVAGGRYYTQWETKEKGREKKREEKRVGGRDGETGGASPSRFPLLLLFSLFPFCSFARGPPSIRWTICNNY
jgi:hypothetical protein